MTNTKKLQNELNEMMTTFKSNIEAQKVESDFPILKRTYSYRKSAAIKANDVRL